MVGNIGDEDVCVVVECVVGEETVKGAPGVVVGCTAIVGRDAEGGEEGGEHVATASDASIDSTTRDVSPAPSSSDIASISDATTASVIAPSYASILQRAPTIAPIKPIKRTPASTLPVKAPSSTIVSSKVAVAVPAAPISDLEARLDRIVAAYRNEDPKPQLPSCIRFVSTTIKRHYTIRSSDDEQPPVKQSKKANRRRSAKVATAKEVVADKEAPELPMRSTTEGVDEQPHDHTTSSPGAPRLSRRQRKRATAAVAPIEEPLEAVAAKEEVITAARPIDVLEAVTAVREQQQQPTKAKKVKPARQPNVKAARRAALAPPKPSLWQRYWAIDPQKRRETCLLVALVATMSMPFVLRLVVGAR